MCPLCKDYGFCQICPDGRVRRVFCDCEAGTRAIERQKQALREVGVDPNHKDFRWLRRSDWMKP